MTHKTKSGPNYIDVHVGCRLRQLRSFKGFTQEKLGIEVGVTFQQVQKYERGQNRIGASRLYKIAAVLNTSILSFFDGLDTVSSGADKQKFDFYKKEEMEMIRYFRCLSKEVARNYLEILKMAARGAQQADEEREQHGT